MAKCSRFRVSTVQRTCTAETSEPAKARSCTTCLMLAPLTAICVVKSANPPGRSLMTATKRDSLPSATRPRSMTRLKTLGSIFPPQSRSTTRLRARFRSSPDKHAARGVAAAPSTTPFCSSTIRKIDSAICCSVTMTARSTRDLAISNAFLPTCGMAKPSARVACISIRVGLPAFNAADDFNFRSLGFHCQRNARD